MIVVGPQVDLFDSVRAVLLADGRFIDGDDTIHCVAPLTNIYPVPMAPAEWAGWESGDSGMPDPGTMQNLVFECRSPAWIAEVGRMLAGGLEGPVWFVDSADVAWPADRVDPDRVRLA